MVAVDNGVVAIQGSFSGIGDPTFLKHEVAAIEGVVDINIHATFLARYTEPKNDAGVNPQRA